MANGRVDGRPDGEGPSLDFERHAWNAGLEADLPLDQKAERNGYRASLIDYERAQRELENFADEVRLQIQNGWRNLEQARRDYEISKVRVELSRNQVREQEQLAESLRRLPWWAHAGALALLVSVVLLVRQDASSLAATFTARRGPLVVSVLEGGAIEALESQMIRSEIEGREGIKILRLVEEGYQVTEDDVERGLVLVALDSSGIEDRITQQEIQFQSTLANLTETAKEKEVQENENLSQIKGAKLRAKFALMDFQKYLGEAAARQILDQIDLNEASIDAILAERLLLSASTPLVPVSRSEPALLDAPAELELPENLPPVPETLEFELSPEELAAPEVVLPEIEDDDIDFAE